MEQELHILIVDDNDEDVAEISSHLSHAFSSLLISHVRSGEEAISRLKNHTYDICLADVLLPRMGGIDLIKNILKHGNNLPVILVTRGDGEQSALKAMKSGAYACLLKSELNVYSLERTIYRAFRDHQTRMEKEKLQKELEAYALQLEALVDERTKEIEYLNNYKELILGNLDVYVRVIDPVKKVVQYESSKMKNAFGDKRGYTCYDMMGKHGECENCISRKAIEKWQVTTKEETVGKRIYSVTSIPLKNMDGTFSAIEVVRDITEHKEADEERERLLGKLSRRVNELDCLYAISRIMAESGSSMEETFKKVVSILLSTCQYLRLASAAIVYDGGICRTENYRESKWKLSSPVMASGRKVGEIHVCYPEKTGYGNQGPFRKEEKYLLNAVAHQLGTFIERKKAEEALEQKSRLAAMGEMSSHLGHEIRGPLHRLGLSYEILCESPSVKGPDRLVVESIGESLEVLFSIANDLLDYSKKGKLHRETFNLAKITDITLSELREKIKKNGIEVEKDYGTSENKINADKLKIHQVLFNVISNAVQAMPEGGKLKVELSQDRGSAKVRISDRGCGISEEGLKKIFVPFYTTKAKGTGLGMPIVKHFVELHKGGLRIESKEGKGTVVTISLPLTDNG